MMADRRSWAVWNRCLDSGVQVTLGAGEDERRVEAGSREALSSLWEIGSGSHQGVV